MNDKPVKAYYFGCLASGHAVYEPSGSRPKNHNHAGPWRVEELEDMCVKYADKTHQPEGEAKLHYREGWTALAVWDRTGDERLGSKSVFVINQRIDFEETLAKFESFFPAVFKQLRGPIKLAAVTTAIILATLLAMSSPVTAQEYAPIILIDVSPPMATPMIPMQFPTPPQLFAPAPVYVSPFINGVIPGVPLPVQFQSSSYAVPYGSPQWVGF